MRTKNNTATIVWSSVICLLPMIMSLIVYEELPEQIAIHWNFGGTPDSFAPKSVAAFGMPVIFFAVNLFSKIQLFGDPKRANISRTMQFISVWTPPLLSLIFVPVTLFIAMGTEIPIVFAASVLVGIVLLVSGNYLPKNHQNYTVGIRLPWTLNNVDNWNKTHRLAGYLYTVGGIAVILGAFLFRGSAYWTLLFAAVVLTIPVLYSYILYRKTEYGTDESEE